MPKDLHPGMSRRAFLATSAAAAVAATFSKEGAAQQPVAPVKKYVRVSLTDPGARVMLDSYATAIKKLLQLPPTDPRNWYRNVFIHTLDCPHGNWWFPPWHRGYLGWFEQTVREFSGNPDFAFPYWDWTAQPYVPDAFWQGVLNPSDSAYIASFDAFKAKFFEPMNQFYAGLSAAQINQLQQRDNGSGTPNFSTPSGFWTNVPSMFFPPSQARSLTQARPCFDASTAKDVDIDTINEALATPFYAGLESNVPSQPSQINGFGSHEAAQHSAPPAGFGILEGLPHNNVHNDVGGFMQDFFSPVDPIFMAHHANIDRLWTVWTSMQEQRGLPTLPTGDHYKKWSIEPFLFYINSAGKQVTQNQAGDYGTIGAFNYIYTPGSGSPTTTVAAAVKPEIRRITGALQSAEMSLGRAAVANVGVASGETRHIHAHITIEPPANPRGVRFHVFVNPPTNDNALDTNDPSYVGTFEFFGGMKHAHSTTFTVPLTDTVRRLRRERAASMTGDSIQVHVIPQTRGIAVRALQAARVTNVEVTTF